MGTIDFYCIRIAGSITDFETPSFAISLYKEYRGLGIGAALMKEMLRILKDKRYKQASLAVQKANYAVKMYQKTGFEIWDENEEECIMLCRLWQYNFPLGKKKNQN